MIIQTMFFFYVFCRVSKSSKYADLDLLESNSINIFVRENQTLHHSTFFFILVHVLPPCCFSLMYEIVRDQCFGD